MTAVLDLTTPLPCPHWCQMPTGHGFDSKNAEGIHRGHQQSLGQASASEGRSVSVDLSSWETAAADDGPVLRHTGPEVGVYMREGEYFSADRARDLAALLLQAADRLDELQNSSPGRVDLADLAAELGIVQTSAMPYPPVDVLLAFDPTIPDGAEAVDPEHAAAIREAWRRQGPNRPGARG